MSEKNIAYPTDKEAKELILEVGRRMYARGFVAANDGNISCRVAENRVWCTPTGVSKGYMTEDMLVLVDMEGNRLEGSCRVSSESRMHLGAYRENPDIRAVCHAHPPVATGFAIAGIALDTPILAETVMGIGVIPLAPFGMPGTEEIPDSVKPFVNSYNACLLANHGVLTWGRDVMESWMRMESVEHYALLTMYSRYILGRANELTEAQIDGLMAIRTRNGVTTGGRPVSTITKP